MNENKAGLGYQDFEEVRTKHIFYIDKTDFIREWWEYADKVTLVTRPRRFGKTLNMSMTECFFSNKYAGRGDLFEGLSIWEEKSPDGEYQYRELFECKKSQPYGCDLLLSLTGQRSLQ